jgi:hypothetical protein
MKPVVFLYPYDSTKIKCYENIVLVVDIDIDDLDKKVDEICKDGFAYPVITTKLFDNIFDTPKIVFKWSKNKEDIDIQKKMLKVSMKNVLRCLSVSQSKCGIQIKLTKKAIEYLYNHTRHIKFQFGNVSEQREISGKFQIVNTKDYFELEIDEKSIERGDKESADPVESFGTFHTHPYDAYKKHKVCIAWPSADDYISFLYMYGLCYSGFHIVSTLEGIYIISLNKYIPPEKVMKDFKKIKDKIEYHHGVDYPETNKNCTIEKVNHKKIHNYVKRINKKGVFNLTFVKWNKCNEPINIKYSGIEKNCFSSKEQGNFFKEINL